MNALPDAPAAVEPDLSTTHAIPQSLQAEIVAVWARPLDFWSDRWADRAEALPAVTQDAAEGILLIHRALFEANQLAVAALHAAGLRQQDALRRAALHQHDLAFAATRAVFSALDGAAAWAEAAPRRALAVCGEALGTAQALGAAVLGTPVSTPAASTAPAVRSGSKPRQ